MRIGNAEHGPDVENLVGEHFEAAKRGGILPAWADGCPCRLDQIRSAREILSGQRVAVIAGKRPDGLAKVTKAVAPAHGERRQPQGSDSAFRAALQGGNVLY